MLPCSLPLKCENIMAEKQDIAMNAFQIVTDAEYIYAETANGSQVKIKKSDLLGALFQSRGEVPSKGYNYCSKSGVYDIVKGVSLPDGPTYGVEYGVLINIVGIVYAAQVIFEAFTSQRILFRFRSETGIWYPWVTFSHT